MQGTGGEGGVPNERLDSGTVWVRGLQFVLGCAVSFLGANILLI